MKTKLALLINSASNMLMGRRHYRIETGYRTGAAVVFTKKITISVNHAADIDKGRRLRKIISQEPDIQKTLHRLLATSPACRDGKFFVEPICYLGRWHVR